MPEFALRVLELTTPAQVRTVLDDIGVDPAGVARMVGKAQSLNVLLESVSCVAANILKQEMLAIGADAAVARGTVACSLECTDVLLMASIKQFGQLLQRLPHQPFGLPRLAQQLGEIIACQQQSPQLLRGRNCCLKLNRPQVMAVVNVTPDSFYDGGKNSTVDTALRLAQQYVADGADILDIGGESTRPGAVLVNCQQELERTIPVVEAVRANFDIPISIDTSKAVVAAAAMNSGANFINDVSGLMFDAGMALVAKNSGAGLFLMHTRGRSDVMQQDTHYDDLLATVIGSLRQSIQLASAAGIELDSIAVDPGIGFGKSVDGNLQLMNRLGELRCLGCPVLVGTSRKSFIGSVLDQKTADQRLLGSLASIAVAVANGVQLFRVHDVAQSRQVLDMAWAICNANNC